MFKAVIVALCVGTLLCFINQYEAIFMTGTLNPYKTALTYTVPFCVYMFGTKSAR